MRRVDMLVLDSRETVTVNGSEPDDLGIIDEGGLAVDKGRIVDVAGSQLLERKYSSPRKVRVSDEVILPGFIDPHSHLVFQGSRENEFESRLDGSSYMDILRKGGGIMETVRKTRETTEDELLRIAQGRLNTAIESGTTAIEIKSGYGLSTSQELKILRTIRQLASHNPCRISSTFLGAHAIPTDSTQEDYAKLITSEMIPIVSHYKLAEFCDVFCESGVFSSETSEAILRTGQQLGLRPKIHADQFTDSGGARLANKVEATSADHLVHSDDGELKRMTNTSVTPVILPASSQSLLSPQYAPARELLSYSLPVALGSDFSPSNWVQAPLTIAAIAARVLRMNSEQLINALTINAARALDLEHQTGSLKRGKSADLVTLRIPNHRWVGYAFGEGLVDKVLIRGEPVVEHGRRLS